MRCVVSQSFVLLMLCLAACGYNTTTIVDSGGGDSTRPPADTGSGPTTVSADVGPLTIAPSREDTVCIVQRLPLDADVFVREVRTQIDAGSHHFIVYRLESGTVRDEPYPCTPFTDILARNGAPIVLAQETARTVRYPEGTGLRLSAGQLVRLELHYINTTAEPLEVAAHVDFDVTPETAELEEVDYIFSGTAAIDIGPRAMGSAGTTFRAPGGINLFAVTTHTHQWATLSTVTLTNAASPSGAEIHRSTSWSEPPLDTFDPVIPLAAGDTFELNCDYTNGSDSRVGFGESANDEMCFMVAQYYPSRGFILDI